MGAKNPERFDKEVILENNEKLALYLALDEEGKQEGITQYGAVRSLLIMQLPATIFKLQKLGFVFEHKTTKTLNNKHYNTYKLVSMPSNEANTGSS